MEKWFWLSGGKKERAIGISGSVKGKLIVSVGVFQKERCDVESLEPRENGL